MLCQECSKRKNCVKLCAKAEASVNQDHVSQREKTYQQTPESGNMNAPLDNISVHISQWDFNNLSRSFVGDKLNIPCCTELENKILVMFYFRGLSYSQIAIRTNIKVRSVEGRLSRARSRIRVFFSKKNREAFCSHEKNGDGKM